MWHPFADRLPSRQPPLMPPPGLDEIGFARRGAAAAGLARARLSLWDAVAADPTLARLADALERCGLQPLLNGARPLTLFAPTDPGLDRAAARLGLGRQLWRRTELLRPLLLHHLVDGAWPLRRLPWPGALDSLAGRPVQLTALGLLRSGDLGLALGPGSDRRCRNGRLHRISEALLPPDD